MQTQIAFLMLISFGRGSSTSRTVTAWWWRFLTTSSSMPSR